jgi:hypothetical protein
MPSSKGKPSTARWVLAAVAAMALVGGAVAVADPDESGPAARGARRPSASGSAASASTGIAAAPETRSGAASSQCGTASARTIAAVDGRVAHHIYTGELTGNEVKEDTAHVTGSQGLLSALASSNAQAVYSAVHTIVYTPHWHIVRLRVVQNGRLLADVGGPYIIAPISGSLTLNGTKVGSYTMSVQDDAGYVKLVSRFIGVPIDLYRVPPSPSGPTAHAAPAGSFLMGTLKPAPGSVSSGATVKVGGTTYLTHVLDALAFPHGKLKAALFVPMPSPAIASHSCPAVALDAWGGVARHIAGRFGQLPAHYTDFVDTLQGSTTGLAYVRVGSRQIAGTSAGPTRIPRHGTVSYRGRSWQVYSWEPVPPARIYFLVPGG